MGIYLIDKTRLFLSPLRYMLYKPEQNCPNPPNLLFYIIYVKESHTRQRKGCPSFHPVLLPLALHSPPIRLLTQSPTPTSPPTIPTHHAGLSVPVQQPAGRRPAAALRVHRMPALGARAVQAVELQPAHHARPHPAAVAGAVANTVGARAKPRGRRRGRWRPSAAESAVVLGRRFLVRWRVG